MGYVARATRRNDGASHHSKSTDVAISPPGAGTPASVCAPCSLPSSRTVLASPSPAHTYHTMAKSLPCMCIAGFVSQIIGSGTGGMHRQGELHGSLQAACWTRTHAGRCWSSSSLVVLVLARRSLHSPSSGRGYEHPPVRLTNRAAAVAARVTTKEWTYV